MASVVSAGSLELPFTQRRDGSPKVSTSQPAVQPAADAVAARAGSRHTSPASAVDAPTSSAHHAEPEKNASTVPAEVQQAAAANFCEAAQAAVAENPVAAAVVKASDATPATAQVGFPAVFSAPPGPPKTSPTDSPKVAPAVHSPHTAPPPVARQHSSNDREPPAGSPANVLLPPLNTAVSGPETSDQAMTPTAQMAQQQHAALDAVSAEQLQDLLLNSGVVQRGLSTEGGVPAEGPPKKRARIEPAVKVDDSRAAVERMNMGKAEPHKPNVARLQALPEMSGLTGTTVDRGGGQSGTMLSSLVADLGAYLTAQGIDFKNELLRQEDTNSMDDAPTAGATEGGKAVKGRRGRKPSDSSYKTTLLKGLEDCILQCRQTLSSVHSSAAAAPAGAAGPAAGPAGAPTPGSAAPFAAGHAAAAKPEPAQDTVSKGPNAGAGSKPSPWPQVVPGKGTTSSNPLAGMLPGHWPSIPPLQGPPQRPLGPAGPLQGAPPPSIQNMLQGIPPHVLQQLVQHADAVAARVQQQQQQQQATAPPPLFGGNALGGAPHDMQQQLLRLAASGALGPGFGMGPSAPPAATVQAAGSPLDNIMRLLHQQQPQQPPQQQHLMPPPPPPLPSGGMPPDVQSALLLLQQQQQQGGMPPHVAQLLQAAGLLPNMHRGPPGAPPGYNPLNLPQGGSAIDGLLRQLQGGQAPMGPVAPPNGPDVWALLGQLQSRQHS